MKTGGLIAKRWPVVGGFLLVAALGGLLWWSPWEARERPEPVYEGKPLSYWLTNQTSERAIRRLWADTNAVPFLIKALKKDSWIGAAVYRKQVWPNLPPSIQKRLPPPRSADINMRFTAVDYLTRMGPLAKPAIPALIRASKDDDPPFPREHVVRALGSIGQDDSTVATALVQALKKDKDAQIRWTAAKVLGGTGKGNTAVLAALTEAALNDPDNLVRRYAASSLSGLDPEAAEVAKATRWLTADNLRTRMYATNALLALYPEAAVKAGISIPALVRSLTNANSAETRQAAAEALSVLKSGDSSLISAWTAALSDESSSTRYLATNALLRLDPEAAAKAHSRQPY